MTQGCTSRVGLLVRSVVVVLGFTVWCLPAFGQGAGGGAGGGGAGGGGAGGAGGGGAGGGGAGGGGTGGGTGNIGLGTLLFGTSGTGSSGVTNPSGTSPISTINPLSYYMASPYASGFGSNVTLKSQNSLALATTTGSSTTIVTGKGTFGVAEYKATTTTPQLNNGIRAATVAAAAATTGTGTTFAGLSTSGTKRAGQYYTTVDRDMYSASAILPPVQLQTDLRSALAQSSGLAGQNVNVSVDGQDTVLLQGTVATERDRQLAEGLIRLTPGVRFVRNEIAVQPR